jgi:hypothetical protein
MCGQLQVKSATFVQAGDFVGLSEGRFGGKREKSGIKNSDRPEADTRWKSLEEGEVEMEEHLNDGSWVRV